MDLRKVDLSNIDSILKLEVEKEQEEFVAPNEISIIEAYATQASGYVALPFGIYKDEHLVGFVMFGYDGSGDAEDPQVAKGNYCIWRFMIDKSYQNKGIGKKALECCIDFIKTFPCGTAQKCWLSYETENEKAKHVYELAGFKESGEMCGEEIVAVLQL